MKEFDLDTFMRRVDYVISATELTEIQMEFVRICQALPNEQRLQLINDYTALVKAKGHAINDKLTILENDGKISA